MTLAPGKRGMMSTIAAHEVAECLLARQHFMPFLGLTRCCKFIFISLSMEHTARLLHADGADARLDDTKCRERNFGAAPMMPLLMRARDYLMKRDYLAILLYAFNATSRLLAMNFDDGDDGATVMRILDAMLRAMRLAARFIERHCIVASLTRRRSIYITAVSCDAFIRRKRLLLAMPAD